MAKGESKRRVAQEGQWLLQAAASTGGGGTTTGPDATPPQLSVKTWGGGLAQGLGGWLWGGWWAGVGGGGVGWRVWGGGVRPGGGGSQGGGAYARPTTTTCILPGRMCVWGGFGEAAGGCCEEGAADGQVCPQWLW